MSKEAFYAVAVGQVPGIYKTWDECKAQVNKYPNARYKKFPTQNLALEFIQEHKTPKLNVNPPKFSPQFSSSKKEKSALLKVTASPCKSTILIPPQRQPTFIPPLPQQQQIRKISTSTADFKRSLRITEDRITGPAHLEPSAKRLKLEAETSFTNSGIDLSGFNVDESGFVVVYTDGACSENGKRGAKAGIGVWFGDKHPLNLAERVKGRQTNNTAEILAAYFAVTQAKTVGIQKLCIKTDSSFLINCITKWINNWKRKGWKLSNGEPVKNKEDLEKLLLVMKDIQIKWSHVRGHRGIHGNEMADQLAVLGSQKPLTH